MSASEQVRDRYLAAKARADKLWADYTAALSEKQIAWVEYCAEMGIPEKEAVA